MTSLHVLTTTWSRLLQAIEIELKLQLEAHLAMLPSDKT
jgi:hypothetical protein